MKSLIFLEQEDKTQIPVNTFPFEVGSYDQYSKYTLNSPNVSPVHFLLILEGDDLILRELNTKIGVKVNEDLVIDGSEVTLNHGDTLDIDGIKLKVIISNDLINESELEEINSKYGKLLEASAPMKINLAQELISILWKKIVSVDNLLEDDIELKEQLSNGYLKEVFKEYLPEGPGPVPVKKAEEVKVEVKKEPVSPPSSFRDRNRQRTFDFPSEEEANSNAVTQSRRINVDKSKLQQPQINRAPAAPVKPERQFFVELKEVNPPYQTIRIDKLPAKVGSSHELADVVIDKRGVSRIHCIIDKGIVDYVIKDNNSTNGTYVNGNPIVNRRADIKLQDIISLYDHDYRVINLG